MWPSMYTHTGIEVSRLMKKLNPSLLYVYCLLSERGVESIFERFVAGLSVEFAAELKSSEIRR